MVHLPSSATKSPISAAPTTEGDVPETRDLGHTLPAPAPVDSHMPPAVTGIDAPSNAPLEGAFQTRQAPASNDAAKLRKLAALFPLPKKADPSIRVTEGQMKVFKDVAESFHLSGDKSARRQLNKTDAWRSNRRDYSFERDVISRLLSIAPKDAALASLAALSDEELAAELPGGIASSTLGQKMAAALAGRVVDSVQEAPEASDAGAYWGLPISSAPPQRRLEQPLTGVPPGSFQLIAQGATNSCGTCSLSMAMRYFQGATADNSVLAIDDAIRASAPIDAFTAPRDIAEYANDHGLRATIRDDSNLGELRAMVEQGVPCVCLTDWSFSGGRAQPNGSLHYVVVTGFETRTNPATGEAEEYVVVANPWGQRNVVLASEFDMAWRGARPDGHVMPAGVMDVPLPFRRLMIPMVPQAGQVTLPDGSKIDADSIELPGGSRGDGPAGWLASFVSGLLRLVNDIINFVGGIFKKDAPTLASIRQDVIGASIRQRAKIMDRLSTSSEADQRALMQEVLDSVDAGDEVALARRLNLGRLAENLTDREAEDLSVWLTGLGPEGTTLAEQFAAARAATE